MKKSRYRILHLSDFHLIAIDSPTIDEVQNAIHSLIENISALSPLASGKDLSKLSAEILSKYIDSSTKSENVIEINRIFQSIKKQAEKNNLQEIGKLINTITTGQKQQALKKMIDSFVLAETGKAYDIIIITGDIFDQGIVASNDPGLKTLLEKIEEKTEHLFIAYGNHDMHISLDKNSNFLKCKKQFQAEPFLSIRQEMQGEKLIRSWLSINGNIEQEGRYPNYEKVVGDILNPQPVAEEGYVESCFNNIFALEKDIFFDLSNIFNENKLANVGLWKDYANESGGWPGASGCIPFSTGVSVVNEEIAIVVLNSAWLNVDSEQCHGHLVVGRPILNAIVSRLQVLGFTGKNGKSKTGKYIITLIHNDFNWHSVREHHYDTVRSKDGSCDEVSSIDTIIRFSDMILCGHEHKETATTLLGLDAYVLKVGGTFRTQDAYTDNTFSVYSLDFAFNTLTREVFNYVAKEDKWKQNEKEISENFTTELKPMDACAKFKQPLRVVDDCFAFLKENALIPNLETDSLQVYDEYISGKHKKWIDEAKQATVK